jgi:hypothetical protein
MVFFLFCPSLKWGEPVYYMIWSGDTTAINLFSKAVIRNGGSFFLFKNIIHRSNNFPLALN